MNGVRACATGVKNDAPTRQSLHRNERWSANAVSTVLERGSSQRHSRRNGDVGDLVWEALGDGYIIAESSGGSPLVVEVVGTLQVEQSRRSGTHHCGPVDPGARCFAMASRSPKRAMRAGYPADRSVAAAHT